MRGSMLARAAGCALAASFFAGFAQAADIADLAPRSSFFVASIDDWGAMKADFEKSGAIGLWKDQKVRDYVRTLFGSLPATGGMTEIERDLEALGVDIDDLPAMGKESGFASFFGPKQGVDGRPLEGDDAERVTHVLIVTSLDGDEAEDGRDLWAVIEDAVERAEDQGDITAEVVDYGDADVYRIISRYETEEWDEDAWEDWDPDAPDADENMPQPQSVEVTDVEYVARAAGNVVYSTSFDALRDAIDRLEGQDRGETIGDVREFAQGRNAKPAGAHAYAVLLPKTFVQEGGALEDLPMPMGLDEGGATQALSALGLTEVTALSSSLVSNPGDAVAELKFAALMGEQRGVFSLMTGGSLPATPPAFVGPDAASLGVFRVNFDQIIPLTRRVVGMLPDSPETQGVQMQFEQFAAPIEPLFNAIGPEVTVVGFLSRPFSASSAGSLYAVSVKDADAVREAVNTLGGMAALMPRDFAGSQIWESQFLPLSIGLGAKYAFVGDVKTVEKAMLAASQPDAPKLADDPRFAAARRAMGEGGIALGWTDVKTTLDYAAWRAEHLEQVTREEATQYGVPEDQIDDYVKYVMEQSPEAARTAPPVDAITRVVGDTVTVFRSTSRGIEGSVRFLKPAR